MAEVVQDDDEGGEDHAQGAPHPGQLLALPGEGEG